MVLESAAAPDAWTYAGMAALSAASCALASMVGLAGGLIITPVLMLLGTPPPAAASAGLAATLASSASSAAAYARQKRIDYSMAIRLGALASPGTVLGAVVLSDADTGLFGILFAAVLAASAAYIFLRSKLGGGVSNARLVLALSASASFMAGIISSFFGIGGGVVFVPLLVAVVGMGMMRAAPTSMLAMLVTSTTAIITHALLGHAEAATALLFAAGGLAGGLAGARASLLLKESHLRAVAAAFLSSIAANLVWDTLSSNAR